MLRTFDEPYGADVAPGRGWCRPQATPLSGKLEAQVVLKRLIRDPREEPVVMAVPIQRGYLFAGRYRVERVLGMDSMGAVLAARHMDLDNPVVIKVLSPELVATPEASKRFLSEFRNAMKIKSEHVARSMYVGTLGDGSPFIVMEFLRGRNLEETLREGLLSVREATDFLLEACEAIAEAHSLGIVHRDLKPKSLFVSESVDGSSCVKVLDFGISKDTGTQALARKCTGRTPPVYMSPEQMIGSADVDARADIWSAGAILYELLSGKPPFEAKELARISTLGLLGQPPPIRTLRDEIPVALEAVILRCLENDKERRWQTVADLAAALAPFGSASAANSLRQIERVLGKDSPPLASSISLPVPIVFAQARQDSPTMGMTMGLSLPGKSRIAWGVWAAVALVLVAVPTSVWLWFCA